MLHVPARRLYGARLTAVWSEAYLHTDPLLDVGEVGEVTNGSETTHTEVKHLYTEERHQVRLATLNTNTRMVHTQTSQS